MLYFMRNIWLNLPNNKGWGKYKYKPTMHDFGLRVDHFEHFLQQLGDIPPLLQNEVHEYHCDVSHFGQVLQGLVIVQLQSTKSSNQRNKLFNIIKCYFRFNVVSVFWVLRCFQGVFLFCFGYFFILVMYDFELHYINLNPFQGNICTHCVND